MSRTSWHPQAESPCQAGATGQSSATACRRTRRPRTWKPGRNRSWRHRCSPCRRTPLSGISAQWASRAFGKPCRNLYLFGAAYTILELSIIASIGLRSGEMVPVRYFSITREPMGTPYVAPQPPFSTYTATAIRGF